MGHYFLDRQYVSSFFFIPTLLENNLRKLIIKHTLENKNYFSAVLRIHIFQKSQSWLEFTSRQESSEIDVVGQRPGRKEEVDVELEFKVNNIYGNSEICAQCVV